MKLLTLVPCIFLAWNSFSQECTINEWINEEYFFDSQILALREIISDTNHLCRDSIRLPSEITNKYLGILTSVFNLQTDISNNLFNFYAIHTFQNIPCSQIAMSLDTIYNWVKAYLLDSVTSGNHTFDSITSL